MRLIYTLELTKLLTKLLKQIGSQAKFNKRKNTTYCVCCVSKNTTGGDDRIRTDDPLLARQML